jgi:hypothetical protein
MRYSPSKKDEFIGNDSKEVIGLYISSDSCSEHEVGISRLKSTLGVSSEGVFGIEKRRINNTDNVFFGEFTHHEGNREFTCAYLGSKEFSEPAKKVSTFKLFGENEFTAGAWDDRNFIFVVRDSNNVEDLKKLYNTLKKGEGSIFLSGAGNPFGGGGLNVASIPDIPKDYIDSMLEKDLSAKRLIEASDKTGIHKILNKAGCEYYALSPSWINDEDESEGIMFWLNPSDQKNNNYGWYEVEELKLWAKGRGRIPKK